MTHDANTPPHWRAMLPRLREWLSQPRIGIISDMDGTLSPIVPHPDDARPTPENRQLLADLHTRLPFVAVISGRAAHDVRSKINLPQLTYGGNHGLERWVSDASHPDGGQVVASPQAQPYMAAMQRIKATIGAQAPAGVWVEDKGVTLSVHYRAHANPAQFRDDYLAHMTELTQAEGVSLFEGRMIFEVRPPLAINKGTIFQTMIAENALDAACFIGDDVTDTDAFVVAKALREAGTCDALAIGVASEAGDTPSLVLQHADMMTTGVDDVAALLRWLRDALAA